MGEPGPRVKRGVRKGLVVQGEVHDRLQFELRFNYPVGKPGRWRFDVDAYFFVPRNVGLNRANYSREQFYSDFTAYMRVDASPLPLEQLADETNPASPLHQMAEVLRRLRSSERVPTRPGAGAREALRAPVRVGDEVRAAALGEAPPAAAAQRDHRPPREGKLALPRPVDAPMAPVDPNRQAGGDARGAAQARGADAAAVPRGARRVVALRAALPPVGSARRDAGGGQEGTMSLALEERLAVLARAAESARDGTGFVARVQLRVRELARQEAEYRERYRLPGARRPRALGGLAGLPCAALGARGGALHLARVGALKKNVQQALYLDLRGSRADTFVRNAVASTGAALAAIWALATQIPTQLAGLPDADALPALLRRGARLDVEGPRRTSRASTC